MNRYLFYCLLTLFFLYLPLLAATAQHRLQASPAGPATLSIATYPAVFTPPPAPLPTALTPLTVAATPPESTLLQYAVQEVRLSWRFIKQLFRYDQ